MSRPAPPPGATTPLPVADRARLVVATLALGALAIGIDVGALGTALPAIHMRLHVSLDRLGSLFSASFLGSLAATLALGPLFDRSPPRPVLLAGLLATVLGLVALSLATTLTAALAARLLVGLGGGVESLGSAVILSRLFGTQGGRALALTNMSFGIGAFVGPPAAAAMIGAGHGYGPIFVGLAAGLLLPLGLFSALPLPGPSRGGAPSPEPRSIPWPAVAMLALLAFLYLGAEIGFGGWCFTFVRQTSRMGVAAASAIPATYWLALSLSSLGAALRPRSWSSGRVVLIGSAGAAAASLGFLLARGSFGLEVAGALAVGLCLGPIYPLTLAAAAVVAPAAKGRAAALVLAASQLGGAAIPWLQGLVLARGPSWGLAVTAGCGLGMVLLQWRLLRLGRSG